ncbi:phosphatase PAP2 family protein [Brevibacterium sp. BRM-1]|uniref:phosphatase PAP2 family protein n=1 Tax=Brevibacterium sp. BRM-1 TaxID=2999062 RepID=UPI002282329B|nr:phosphatase PAP2 family protein [Brevibacterium sp. BRM-1]WAL39299.1 phosphatase PAP2 family protein [Brevibacterium sp. BRM-1]
MITAWAVAVTEAFSPAGTILLALATGLVLWWARRSWRVPVYVFGSVALAAGITYLLKFVFERQRPPAIDRLVFEADYSFPSGHATGTAALACAAAVVVCGMLRRPVSMALVWAAALGLSVLVAATRLYLGVHWFTDTAAGFCVGAGTALVLSALIDPGRAPGLVAAGGAATRRSSESGPHEGRSHEGGPPEARSHGGGASEG